MVQAVGPPGSGDKMVAMPLRRSASPARASTFASLRTRNYRLFFVGQIISVSGTWMQTVAQGWLVLRLTHNGTDLGLITAARFLPMMVLHPGADWWPIGWTSAASCM